MIKRVRISGFQSLSDIDISLGKFTVIQGRSNSGKSAFIRALRAVVSNGSNLRGTGGSYITHGMPKASIEITQDDGVVRWVKSPKKTTYELNGRVFTTGQEVPEQVADFLQLGDLVVDHSNNLKVNVNFQGGARGQGQFEPPFLVVDRAGSYLAKVLSLLTSANLLYAAQALAKKDSRAKSDKLKAISEVEALSAEKLAGMQSVHAPLKEACTRASDLLSEVVSSSKDLEVFEDSFDSYVLAQAQLSTATEDLASVSVVDVSKFYYLLDEFSLLNAHQAWQDGFLSLRSARDAEQAKLDKLAELNLDGKVEDVFGLNESLSSLEAWASAVSSTEYEINACVSQIEHEQRMADEAEAELHSLLANMDICPTCNQRVEAAVL